MSGPVLPVEVRYGRDDMREPVFTPVIERGSDGAPGGSDPVSDAGWLVVAIVAGVLFVFGWIKRERWIARRRRRRLDDRGRWGA